VSEPNIAKISVTAGEFSVETLRVTMAVNEIPTAAVTTLRAGGETVRKPLSADIISTLRGRQQKRLAGLPSPDVSISADDGNGGKLEFKGFMVAPVLEISTTSTVDSFTALGLDGILDALDLSIYEAGYKVTRGEASVTGNADDEVVLDPIPSADSGDVEKLLGDITDVLVGNYDKTLQRQDHPSLKKLITQQHSVNSGLPLETWKKILSNSKVNYESWSAACTASPGMASQITSRMHEVLVQKNGGFWSTVNALMATFQMYYVPSTSDSGTFFRADKRVEDASGNLDLSVTSVNVSDGNHRLMPIGGVVMMRQAASNTRTPKNAPKIQAIAAQYPDPLLPGFTQREVPPVWLLHRDGSHVVGIDKKGSGGKKPLDLSKDGYISRKEGAIEIHKGFDDAAGSVLDELCKVIFKEMQVAHSTAMATIPLDFTQKVGKRVTVEVLSGGSFTAFVSRVVHSVDLRQGKDLNSFTQLSFSHVRY
jgi:hypothetical protein